MFYSLTTQTKLRLFGPPVLFLFGTVFFRLRLYLTLSPGNLLATSVVGILLGYVGWELARWTIHQIQTRQPGLALTKQRLRWELLAGLLLVLINAALRFGIIFVLNPVARAAGRINAYDFVEAVGVQLFYTGVYIALYEGGYVVEQWQATFREKERATKAEWQARFDALKSQISPHFLFNALNSLSSLIDESPMRAGKFVDELSKVYRYLLQANGTSGNVASASKDDTLSGLASVSDELRFIASYTHLLQTRHGAGLSVQVDVAPAYHAHRLPALSLQLLVENAVKHNVVTPTRPLTITITPTATGALRVRNNRQKKHQRERILSNGVGLSNIVTRYRMLTDVPVRVADDDAYFSVELPLLPSPN